MNHAHFRPAWDRTTHLPTSYDMSKIVLLAMLGSAVLPAMASGDVSVVQPAADRTLNPRGPGRRSLWRVLRERTSRSAAVLPTRQR